MQSIQEVVNCLQGWTQNSKAQARTIAFNNDRHAYKDDGYNDDAFKDDAYKDDAFTYVCFSLPFLHISVLVELTKIPTKIGATEIQPVRSWEVDQMNSRRQHLPST